MHHKFLVFGHRCQNLVMSPGCVVTGSFNLTPNAVRSRENVLLIEDMDICHAYLSEWAQLWSMSEPLDWSSLEPAPEKMYVGT
jgi:phosphatidylserine/phosphatidylglycerophosphate/cardiolipin synthase-like enzyme